MKNLFETRVQGTAATLMFSVGAKIVPVFDFIVPEDVLPKVLTGYGLLPGVVRTSGNTGPWDSPGSPAHPHRTWSPPVCGQDFLVGATTDRKTGRAATLPMLSRSGTAGDHSQFLSTLF